MQPIDISKLFALGQDIVSGPSIKAVNDPALSRRFQQLASQCYIFDLDFMQQEKLMKKKKDARARKRRKRDAVKKSTSKTKSVRHFQQSITVAPTLPLDVSWLLLAQVVRQATRLVQASTANSSKRQLVDNRTRQNSPLRVRSNRSLKLVNPQLLASAESSNSVAVRTLFVKLSDSTDEDERAVLLAAIVTLQQQGKTYGTHSLAQSSQHSLCHLEY